MAVTTRKPQAPKRRRTKRGRGRPDVSEVRCPTGKTAYRSYAAAERALEKIAEDDSPGREKPSRAYACDVCPMFHLTSQDQRSGRL